MFHQFFKYLLLFNLMIAGSVFFSSCAGGPPPLIAIEVDPLCTQNFAPGDSLQFNACIYENDVVQGYDNSAVTWTVLGGDVNGTITQSGLYQSPNTNPPPAPTFIIIATSKEDPQKAGQATIVMDPNVSSCPGDIVPSLCAP